MVLTGLPPTPAEVDDFLEDARPDAFERRVDALLASPRAAEHMALAWLDLARFADTFGYQSDGPMFSWPWRDWLLEALQANTPYDELVTRMVAGDQLPDASVADRVGSAFQRLHRLTEEGGSIPEEFRQEGIADRVSTYGTAFLGLTLEYAATTTSTTRFPRASSTVSPRCSVGSTRTASSPIRSRRALRRPLCG
jgi:hypothetical protein